MLVAGHVGQDPELDLRVVGGDQRHVGTAGDERAPDPSTERRPDRDVLEVRIGRRQPAGRRDGLVEGRVQPAIGRDEVRQRLDIRRAELGVGPPLEQALDHRVGRPELLEDRGVRGVARLRPLALREVELAEQDLLQLLRTAEIELVPDAGVDLPLETLDLGPELDLERRQRLPVEGDADRLHPRQNGDQRQLDLAEQAVEALALQGCRERFAGGDRRQRLEPGPGERGQLGRRRQDQVELLGDDVGDRLAAQAGVQDVRGDLGVEGDGRRSGRRVLGEPGDEKRLHLVGDERTIEPLDEVAQSSGILGPGDRHRPAIGSSDGQCQRGPDQGTRVVEDESRPDRRLGREPRLEGIDGVARNELDPAAGVGDGGRQCARQIGRGLDRPARGVRPGGGRSRIGSDGGGARPGCRAVHRPEVERQLEAGPLPDQRARSGSSARTADRCGAPAGRPTRDLGGPDRIVAVGRPERLDGLLRTLAAQRRKPLDEGPELVLAEQADDPLAVVLAETGRLEVELDRQVAQDRHQLPALEDPVAGLSRAPGAAARA